ncbi:capsule assembly Wzi family protein [Marinomonas sp. C2222]|uniref:Capsule assembly Wzi family protein n=1 Tax=Marinomonas sargassi TaxID=2984494 RepID=A0ABT2YP39_9GAMM|nr:capsule assembly Wzi family protein [Marinomonas sargassi]MCV2401653.1 capsule assembly Wzi family protein [Marinomonas sargassi]
MLSDAGNISSPINIYPLRWSMFGDDLGVSKASSDAFTVTTANQEILYALNSIKLNRGNRLFKVSNSIYSPLLPSFGQFSEDEWGIYTSVDHLSRDFSYRFTIGYGEYSGESELNWNDSYLSLSAGEWLFSIGNLNRWWGQGWQHNLILASYAKSAPDMSVSYMGLNAGLGSWFFESLISSPENNDVAYHSATRLVSKPLNVFEYGVTYQVWLADLNSGEQDQQLSIDAKLVLPSLDCLYHSVYSEVASTSNVSELGAWLIGWTGSFPIANHSARIVLESQQTTSAHDSTAWDLGDYPSVTENVSNTSYLLDESQSIAFYLQLKNDHSFGLIYQKSKEDDKETSSKQLTYRLPILSGMGHVGLSFDRTVGAGTDNDINVWAGYEFRF